MNRAMRSVHPAERKTVTHYSAPVLILMILKASNAAEKDKSDTRQKAEESLELFVDPTVGDPNNITAARQVVLTALYKKPVLVST